MKGGRERGREGGREGERERGREGEREGGREGGRERGREGGREGGRKREGKEEKKLREWSGRKRVRETEMQSMTIGNKLCSFMHTDLDVFFIDLHLIGDVSDGAYEPLVLLLLVIHQLLECRQRVQVSILHVRLHVSW